MYHPSSVAFIVEGASFNQYVIFLQQYVVQASEQTICSCKNGDAMDRRSSRGFTLFRNVRHHLEEMTHLHAFRVDVPLVF